jgi:hypothetical protein
MSSRQAEKEQRRQERLERERAEAAAAGRRKRLQYAFGGVLGLAAIAGVVVLLTAGLGGGGGGGADSGDGPRAPEANADVKLPVQQTADMDAAAKAAGCTLANPPIEGSTHVDKEFKPSDYKTNPPTSGDHFAQWYEDGIYAPGSTANLGMAVHTLEHGRIDVQYKPGTPAATVAQLEALLAEQSQGYHMLLFENTTRMDAQVAATAWGHSVTCPAMNDKVFDALRTFRARWIDKGPEQVP